MEYQTLLVIVVVAAIVHVAEEYIFGWVTWANRFIPGVTVRQFAAINLLFIALCVLAIILRKTFIVFSSSMFSLLLINSLVHIIPTIKQKRYSPGLVSAVLLYIPIGVTGYSDLLRNHIITNKEFIISILVGIFFMSVPFIYQAIRVAKERKK